MSKILDAVKDAVTPDGDGEVTQRRKQDPVVRAARDAARATIAEAVAAGGLPDNVKEAIKLLINVDGGTRRLSVSFQVIEYIKANGPVTSKDLLIEGDFDVAKAEMRKIIYDAQVDQKLWIGAFKAPGDRFVTYTYFGESEECPDDYKGPIHKSFNIPTTDPRYWRL